MTDVEIMKELLAYAKNKMDTQNAYPFAAFIVKNGVIISRGVNVKVQDYGDKTTHGEMEALTRANKALNLKHLVVLGEDYELFSTCEPCLACFDASLWANVKRFVFSVDHNDFPNYFHDHPYTIETFEKENPGEIQVTRGLLHDEGISLFTEARKKYGW